MWFGWVYLNGSTLDAPSVANGAGGLWAAVRGLDNRLYYRNITNCDQSSWINTGFLMSNTPPQMIGEDQSVRIHFQDNTGRLRVYQIQPFAPPMQLRWFGDDTDMHSVAFTGFDGLDTAESFVGLGFARHFNFRFGDASPTFPGSGLCNIATVGGFMNTGSSTASLCYGGEVGTGDTLINLRFSPTGAFGKYAWRQCNVGFGDDIRTFCDESQPLTFFPSLAQTQQILLRAKVSIPSASHVVGQGNTTAVGITMRFSTDLPGGPSQAANEVEISMLPFLDNASAQCLTSVSHDGDGRHVFNFTPACVGASNVVSGQTRFYNLNLRSYIAQKFQDHFQSINGRHDDLISYDLGRWYLTYGGAFFLDRFGNDSAGVIVDDLSIEAKF